MEFTKIINGHECRLKVSCLKYSRVSESWLLFSKTRLRRKPFSISELDAESLLRQRGFTRHDRGEYVLFQANANAGYLFSSPEPTEFDLKKLL